MNRLMIGKKFNKALLPGKENFYSDLNMEDITDVDYMHARRVCKDFEIKNQEDIIFCKFAVIHYFQLMYLRTLEIYLLKYINLIMQNVFCFLAEHGKQLQKKD